MHGCLGQKFRISFFVCMILVFSSVKAEVIEKKLANDLIATAEFHQGDTGAPAILLLHGFLQTRESHTVAKLYSSLVDAGYTVLAPTLSLGLSHRKQSLACEAIHSHSMQSDIAELDMWTKWLSKKASSEIILLGHSAGSVMQLAYLGQYPTEHIERGIFVSLSYFGVAPASHETKEDGDRARNLIKQGKKGLDKYGLSYCKDYVTTASNYLSYYDWQPKKILGTMKKIHKPVIVIIGSQDQRISGGWVSSMEKNNIRIYSVQGAGHFFDNEYEFELLDAVESILTAN